MLVLHCFNRLNKVLLFNPVFSSKLRVKSWKICFILTEVLNSAEYFSSFLFFDSGTVKSCRNLSLRFSGIIFLLFCFASDENWNRVYRVAGENSTTEPPMLDVICFDSLNKVLLFNPTFSSKLWTKSWKLCYSLIEFLNSAEYFGSFLIFDSGTV